MLVRDARDEFFRINNLGPDGGLSDRWVRIEAPFPFYIPNVPARRRAVVLHDIHHIAVPCDTSWTGEGEISAWELAGGCTDYWVAWTLDFAGLIWGLILAPRKVFSAFCRGRRSHNLYHQGYSDSILSESMGALRERLGIVPGPVKATAADIAAFSLWVALAIVSAAAPLAVVACAAVFLLRR